MEAQGLVNSLLSLLIMLCFSFNALAARVINTVTLDGGFSTTVNQSVTIPVTMTVTTSGSGANDDWESTSYTLDGVTTCLDTTNFGGDGTYTDTFTVTAPATDGSYDIAFYAHRNGACNPGSDSNYVVLTDGVIVSGVSVPVLAGEWRMDDIAWAGSLGDVADSSGNSFDGQPFNGLRNSDTAPAIPSSPGTCRYGEFDGSNDYIEIPHSASLNGSSALSYTAWIRPDTWSGSIRQIMAKSVHGGGSGRAQMGIFSESGNLKGRAETSNGRIDITTSLPTTDGSWTHVALVFNGTGLFIYTNGVLRNSASFSNRTLNQNNDPLNISRRVASDRYYFDGGIDEVRVYTSALSATEVGNVMAETRPCSLIDHYAITYSGTPLTCEPLSITVEARDSLNAPVIPENLTTISLSTSVGVDAVLPSSSFTFSGAESSATFQISQTLAGLVDIDVSDGAISEPDNGGAEDQRPTFLDTALRFIEDNGAGGFDLDLDNRVAGAISPSSGANTIYVEAVQNSQVANPSVSPACVAALPPNTSVSVDLGAECKNPSSCAGVSLKVSNNGVDSAVATTDSDGGAATVSGYTTRNLLFDANSRAPLVISYSDVGLIELHGRYEALDNNGAGLGFYISGQSNEFIVSPHTLAITAIETDSAASSSNPETTGSGAGFLAAGSPFYVEVESRDTLGNVTPNYGNENSPEGILIDINSLVFPTGGDAGSLLNGGAFTVTSTPGIFENSTLAWADVGTLTLNAHVTDGDYLGAGDVASVDVSGNVGRFFPDHFELTASIEDACTSGNFTYMDQDDIDLNSTVGAYAVGNTLVGNYDTSKLYPVATATYSAENMGDGSDLISRLTSPLQASVWLNGQLIANSSSVEFQRSATPDGPYLHVQLGIVLDDSLDSRTFNTALDFNPASSANFLFATSDDGCVADGGCTGMKIGDPLDVRFGRLFLQDGHGPESAPLPVKFQVEYWNGNLFVANTLDSSTPPSSDGCTSILRSRFILDGTGAIADFDVTVGASSTTAGFASAIDTSDIFMSSGAAGLIFSAPLTQGSFPLQILNLERWLQFDWDQDGNYSDANHPAITVSFGSYRGHDGVIYWREIFN